MGDCCGGNKNEKEQSSSCCGGNEVENSGGCCGGETTESKSGGGCCCSGDDEDEDSKKGQECCDSPEKRLKVNRLLRGIAGAMLMLSTLLYFYHSPNWIWFMAFIGLNLFQSAFTCWCPMITFLNKMVK